MAARTAAATPAGGYTLLSVSSAHAVAPAIYARLPFDPIRDFAPISLTATGPALVVVAPDLPVKTIADVVALARSKPGLYNDASAGVGSGGQYPR